MLVCKLAPIHGEQGWGRPEKEAGHSRLAGGSSTSKETYTGGFSSAAAREKISTPALQNLKVYVVALTRFNHLYHPNGLSNTLRSQGCILGMSSHCGNSGQSVHSKDRKPTYQSVANLLLAENSDNPIFLNFVQI